MFKVSIRWLVPLLIVLLAPLASCRNEQPQAPAPAREGQKQVPAAEREKQEEVKQSQAAPEEQGKTAQTIKAEAEVRPTQGNDVTGTVTFTSEAEGVRIVADLEGLAPGRHGFHIHEKGDCSAPDAESAGGHFNPEGSPHGAPDNPATQRHVGDLGNVESNTEGKAHYERKDKIISLEGENSIVGKAVIVHAQPDDLESQPSGGAGPRVACGVIQARE